jgi:hypothetical protein
VPLRLPSTEVVTMSDPQALLLELSETDLVRLGEQADGGGERELLLIRDREGRARLRQAAESGDQVVSQIRIRPPAPTLVARPRLAEIVGRSADGASISLRPETDQYDCLFWSESAVRKFVWPYYHAHRLWDSELQRLRDQWESDPTAVAIAHQAPTKSVVLQLSR